MGGLSERIRALGGRLGTQRLVAVAVVAVVTAGVLVFALGRGGPGDDRDGSWVPLFGDLPAAEVARVIDRLDSLGVPWRLQGSSTVLVPADQVTTTRVRLAAEGVPDVSGSGPGWSLLDHQGLTTSEFRQRVDYQRALEGELARTITAIDGIRSAQVHLVLPRADIFAADDQRPTASVLVDTGGRRPAPEAVRAIVHLVAGSVERLDPADVTVADTTGRVLSAEDTDGAGSADLRAQATTEFENRLSERVLGLVEPVVGAGQVRVAVTAELDFDRTSVESEVFNPQDREPPLATERSTEETFTGPAQGSVGILGPDGEPVGDQGQVDYQRTDTDRTWAVDRTVTRSEQAPGDVRRLTVAVAVPDTVDDQTLAAIDTLVRTAVGADPDRGDEVTVSRVPMVPADTGVVDEPPPAEPGTGPGVNMVAVVVVGLLAAGAVIGALVGLRVRRRRREADELTRAARAAGLPVDTDLDDDATAGTGTGDAGTATGGPPVDDGDGTDVLDEDDPEVIARAVSGWLDQES